MKSYYKYLQSLHALQLTCHMKVRSVVGFHLQHAGQLNPLNNI